MSSVVGIGSFLEGREARCSHIFESRIERALALMQFCEKTSWDSAAKASSIQCQTRMRFFSKKFSNVISFPSTTRIRV